MVEKYDNRIIIPLTDTQREHLDLVTGSTGLTLSEVVRMAIEPLTPAIVREMKIADLNRQAEAIAKQNIGLPLELQKPLPGPFRVKRRYRKSGKYTTEALRQKRERADVSSTGPRSEEVEDRSFSPSKPRK